MPLPFPAFLTPFLFLFFFYFFMYVNVRVSDFPELELQTGVSQRPLEGQPVLLSAELSLVPSLYSYIWPYVCAPQTQTILNSEGNDDCHLTKVGLPESHLCLPSSQEEEEAEGSRFQS